MPGSNSRALEKALTLPCDALVLDLEDAVAPDAKDMARVQVSAAVTAGGFGGREVVVRVNAPGTAWFEADMAAALEAKPDAILVPKVNGAADIEALCARMGRGAPPLWIMIETPLALLNAATLAEAARGHVAAFVLGTNDLMKETGARFTPGRAGMLPWLSTALLAARAAGAVAIDGVFNALDDAAGFDAECRQGRELGFDGKTVIHPKQIEPANAAFSPSEAEVGAARRILEAFALPENAGRGAISLDGRMVERLHADMAAKVVALAEAIEGQKAA